MVSCGTGLGGLGDHPRPQQVQLLIDGLFDLGQGRFRVRCSPLRHGGKDILAFYFLLLL
jgi:hypothetical protein